MARLVIKGKSTNEAHRCVMPIGHPDDMPSGSIAFCDECGAYWRLARWVDGESGRSMNRRQYVPGLDRWHPIWYELGMFGTWLYVQREGHAHVQ